MTESGRSPWRWLGYGCAGCLGIILLLIVIGGVLTGVAWVQARNENLEDRVLVREFEAAAVVPVPEAEPMESTGIEPVPERFTVAGRINLRLHQAEVVVRPGTPGEPIRVEANYDTNSHTLEERYEPGSGADPWTYDVEFSSSGSFSLVGMLKGIFGTSPKVKVYLPPDVPVELDVDIMQGGGEVELGGLWLTSAKVKFMQGGGALSISEPLPVPMESLEVEWSMGGGAIVGIGNASPRLFDLRASMGGGSIDLGGPWVRDAEIRMEFRQGGGAVVLPDGVVIRGLEGFGIEPPASVDIPAPVLTFHVDADPDDVVFER